MPRATPAVPADLQELSGRFEDWRRTRSGRQAAPATAAFMELAAPRPTAAEYLIELRQNPEHVFGQAWKQPTNASRCRYARVSTNAHRH
jgi:hypothetical protein